jgi:hypothetical protein
VLVAIALIAAAVWLLDALWIKTSWGYLAFPAVSLSLLFYLQARGRTE